jgi:hypothetical protein
MIFVPLVVEIDEKAACICASGAVVLQVVLIKGLIDEEQDAWIDDSIGSGAEGNH